MEPVPTLFVLSLYRHWTDTHHDNYFKEVSTQFSYDLDELIEISNEINQSNSNYSAVIRTWDEYIYQSGGAAERFE